MSSRPIIVMSLVAGAVVATGLGGAAAAWSRTSAPDAGEQRTIAYRSVVDLSHVIDTDIPLWPGDPAVALTPVAEFDTDGYYLRSLTIGEHSGTHMNAPNSFLEGGAGIDEYAPESLVLSVVVIDVRSQAAVDPDYALTRHDVEAWESENEKIPAGSLVVAFTGWQDRWTDPTAFFGEDADGGLHFPGFDGDATEWLLAERAIAGVGIDTHGVDPGQDEEYRTNTAVLAGNGVVLENLTNLDQVPATGATIVIGVLRLAGGSGSPASVLAFVP